MAEITPAHSEAGTLLSENLKALRLLHQLLMVVAAAILVFALRPDQTEIYEAALNELLALKEMRFDGWPAFINQHYRADEDRNTAFVRAVVREAGLQFLGNPELNQPTLGNLPPFIEGAKLIEFDGFFSGTQRIGVVMLGGNKRPLVEQLRKAASTRNAQPRVAAMSLGGTFASSGYFGLTDWRNLTPTGAAVLQFVISDQPQTLPNPPASVIASYSINSDTEHFALEWLRSDTFGEKLLDRHSGTVFPHLKVFWDRVSTLTDNEATVFLQEELSSSRRGTVSFFGISVERSLALSAGPTASLAILIFLALHLQHFQSRFSNVAGANGYPWVALFGSTLAKTVTICSILILPSAANVALLRSYGHWSDLGTRTGIGLSVLSFVVSVWVIIEIAKLRRRT